MKGSEHIQTHYPISIEEKNSVEGGKTVVIGEKETFLFDKSKLDED